MSYDTTRSSREERKVIEPRKYLPGGPEQFLSRSILATWDDREPAQRCANALREEGYEVQVDDVTWREDHLGDVTDRPLPETLTGQTTDGSTRDLAAMDPAVSGWVEGGNGGVGGNNVLITVVTEGKDQAKALEIIRRHGGNVDSGGPR